MSDRLTIQELQDAAEGRITIGYSFGVAMAKQLLAIMQRETKLREALEDLHALYAETDRTLDPEEVCGRAQGLLYCNEYSNTIVKKGE